MSVSHRWGVETNEGVVCRYFSLNMFWSLQSTWREELLLHWFSSAAFIKKACCFIPYFADMIHAVKSEPGLVAAALDWKLSPTQGGVYLPGSPRPRLPPHILTEVAPLSLFSASTPRCSILGVSLVFLRVAVSVLENVRISVNPDLFAVLNVYFHNSLKFLHRNSIILVIFSEVQSIKTTTTTIQRQLTTLRIFRLL